MFQYAAVELDALRRFVCCVVPDFLAGEFRDLSNTETICEMAY